MDSLRLNNMSRRLWAVLALTTIILPICFAQPRVDVCPDGCKCYDNIFGAWFNCSYAGFEQPPTGDWPKITVLWLVGNNIKSFEENSLSGFPALESLWVSENPTPVLKLDSFPLSSAANLQKIVWRDSQIEDIVPLSIEYEMNSLEELDFGNNSLMWVDRNLLSNMPKLDKLILNDNPLVVIKGSPLLSHANLNYLGLSRINAYALSRETFELLPNLGELALIQSRVLDMAGAFLHLDKLVWLYLQDNLLTSVESGQLAQSGKLRWINVARNPLQRFDPSALDGALHAGYVMIDDTPLACMCAYDDLYWWAKEDKTSLTADCGYSNYCEFSKL